MYICIHMICVFYTFFHVYMFIFAHLAPWVLICRSRYETPNGEEEAPYYLESKIRQTDGLSRAELTDSEPRLELAIQNPYPPTDFLKMMCFSPWNWKNPGRLTGTWFTYKFTLQRERKMIIQPNLHDYVPTLIFRVGVVSFLGSSPPTSPNITQGRRIGPRNCLRNSACKPLVPLHAVFPLPLVAGKVWFGVMCWGSSSSEKMIQVAAGQQDIRSSTIFEHPSMISCSHFDEENDRLGLGGGCQRFLMFTLGKWPNLTSMKPRPGSAASSHRDLATPEVKQLVYPGKWMVGKRILSFGMVQSIFRGELAEKTSRGGSRHVCKLVFWMSLPVVPAHSVELQISGLG